MKSRISDLLKARAEQCRKDLAKGNEWGARHFALEEIKLQMLGLRLTSDLPEVVIIGDDGYQGINAEVFGEGGEVKETRVLCMWMDYDGSIYTRGLCRWEGNDIEDFTLKGLIDIMEHVQLLDASISHS